MPFATHSAVAAAPLRERGKVDYAAKDVGGWSTFFKGTGERGMEGSLGRLTEARVALEALVGEKGHEIFLSSPGASVGNERERRERKKTVLEERRSVRGHAEGMLSSTFCWVPRRR